VQQPRSERIASGWRQVLDEIQAGIFDGMTYAEIEQNMPEEFAARKADKLGYRCTLAPGVPVISTCT